MTNMFDGLVMVWNRELIVRHRRMRDCYQRVVIQYFGLNLKFDVECVRQRTKASLGW